MKLPRYMIFKIDSNRKGTKLHVQELTAEEVARIIQGAEEFDRIMTELGNCNNCGRAPGCGWLPAWGEDVRINCPLWAEIANPDEELAN